MYPSKFQNPQKITYYIDLERIRHKEQPSTKLLTKFQYLANGWDLRAGNENLRHYLYSIYLTNALSCNSEIKTVYTRVIVLYCIKF